MCVFFFPSHFHRHTYSSLIPEDYDNEPDDVDQNGIDDANGNGNAQQPDTNSVQQNIDLDRDAKKVDIIEATSPISTDLQIDTNEISVPQPSKPNSVEHRNEISVNVASCDVNNGGCEQTCNIVPNDGNGGNVIECSCNEGFYLEKEGGTNCLGKLNFMH